MNNRERKCPECGGRDFQSATASSTPEGGYSDNLRCTNCGWVGKMADLSQKRARCYIDDNKVVFECANEDRALDLRRELIKALGLG